VAVTLDEMGVSGLFPGGDALIIVPPFARVGTPSLAAHLLQACARERGFRVSVLYANHLLAALLGEATYTALCDAPTTTMLGERLFARAAHGLLPLGEPEGSALELSTLHGAPKVQRTSEHLRDIPFEETGLGLYARPELGVEPAELRRLEALIPPWADAMAELLSRLPYRIVGATTTFEQTNASFALLERLKRLRPDVITLLGGANCEGEMAQGIASIHPCIDFIFSGEGDATFPAFLQALAAGKPPRDRIIIGTPRRDLDALPLPDYREYLEQRERFLPDSRAQATWIIPYESSRGCWWGQKHHCTFCGLNGEGMGFRQKSPARVLGDLRALAAAHGTRRIAMADNIMPRGYFRTLLPLLEAEPEPFHLFYEQKANLSLADVLALKRAGIRTIQPGIESLSSSLLRLMKKGVLARQNVALLRYARAAGLAVEWNLLWGFPGDAPESYEETLSLVPLLHHVTPPGGLFHISLDRFSPYTERSAEHGVSNLRYHPNYESIFPPHTAFEKVAYRFVADYSSGAYECLPVLRELAREVGTWHARWGKAGTPPPSLRLTRVGEHYILRDTRGLSGTQEMLALDRSEARAALSTYPCSQAEAPAWALERKLGVWLDGWYVALATASPPLLEELEAEARSERESVALQTQSPTC
jgi:ribosomal peptide maturation radical SAM protein 1